ncbi:hypothetical protein CMI37_04075 [Candidatus Pacearchaeota archaeon]|nr:hypothetical protein [Candidatus Pacearchaeota archaeon]
MAIYCNVTECLNWQEAEEPAITHGLLERSYTGVCSRSSIDIATTTLKKLGGYRFDLSVCKSINQEEVETAVGIKCLDADCKFNWDNLCMKPELKDSHIYIDIDDRGIPICKSQAVKSRSSFTDWTKVYETSA